MNELLSLTSEQLKRAAGIKDQIQELEQELAAILGAPAPAPVIAKRGRPRKVVGLAGPAPKKGGMSAAGRARIAAAQRARWAKVKAQQDGQGVAKSAEKPVRKKRKMSAAGRARIIAAQKARWAKVRAAKKA